MITVHTKVTQDSGGDLLSKRPSSVVLRFPTGFLQIYARVFSFLAFTRAVMLSVYQIYNMILLIS